MRSIASRCAKWMTKCAVLKGARDVSVSIVLLNDTLTRGFLSFDSDSKIIAFVPITSSVSVSVMYVEGSILFEYNEPVCLPVVFESTKMATMFQSQVMLCSHASRHPQKPLDEKIIEFLMKYGKKSGHVEIPVSYSYAMPMIGDQEAEAAWKRRSEFVNIPFYTTPRQVSACFLSWNVEQRPPDESTPKFIQFLFDKGIDIIVISLQEIDFSAKAVLLGESKRRSDWLHVFDVASHDVNYETILSENIGGVYLGILIKNSLDYSVTAKLVDKLRLGGSGLAANKSAVCAVLDVSGVSIGVSAVHLAPHVGNIEVRNGQLEKTIAAFGETRLDYHVVLGDLNYRIDNTYEDTLAKIESKDLKSLLEKDQLIELMRSHPLLRTFKEPPITFKPTFKFDDFCNVYDTSPKHRVPAWTDRVIVQSAPPRFRMGPADAFFFETDLMDLVIEGRPVKLPNMAPDFPLCPEFTSYRSYDIQFSDHRPVSLECTFKVPIMDRERKRQLTRAISEKLAAIRAKCIPILTPMPPAVPGVDTQTIELRNGSSHIAYWDVNGFPTGVMIEPSAGFLYPGQSISVKFTMNKSVSGTTGIIHVSGGHDVVISFL